MFQIERDDNGWTITAKDVLSWIVPAMLALISTGIVMVWARLGDVHDSLEQIGSRVTVIEASRFTSADGLAVWQQLGKVVTREELQEEIQEVKDMVRDDE